MTKGIGKRIIALLLMVVMVMSLTVPVFADNGTGEPEGPGEGSTEPSTCTVTYDPNGGSLKYSPKTVNTGECAPKPPTPIYEGYIFKGWFYNGEEWNFSRPVRNDMTLVAQWEKEPEKIYHTVVFNFNGGKISDEPKWANMTSYTGKVADGDTLNELFTGSVADNIPPLASLVCPPKEGQTFKGWWDSNGKQYKSTTVITSNVTLTARWSELPEDNPNGTWTVTLDANGGYFDDFDTNRNISKSSVKVVKGKSLKETEAFMTAGAHPDSISVRNPLHRQGYTFLGWYNGNQKWDISNPVTSDMALVAHWSDPNGGNGSDNEQGTETPTVTYSGPEWKWNGTESAKATFTESPSGEKHVIDAKITHKTTDATYDKEGKTVYTAKVTFNGKEYTDTKTVTIPKLERPSGGDNNGNTGNNTGNAENNTGNTGNGNETGNTNPEQGNGNENGNTASEALSNSSDNTAQGQPTKDKSTDITKTGDGSEKTGDTTTIGATQAPAESSSSSAAFPVVPVIIGVIVIIAIVIALLMKNKKK